MRIVVFADIHGKILLPFKMADLYQKQTGKKIDFILQCGDIGAYPDMNNLDKATIRHAQYDRDELGFHDDFTTIKPHIKEFLDQLGLDMICVRGNHEDHDYIDKIELANPDADRFPIDIYKRVFVCKTGVKQLLQSVDEQISFVGIGRIGDRKERNDKKFIQDYERVVLKKLQKTNDDFDVLITHDKDDSSERGYGMAEIRNLLDNVIFHYHFYGHTGEPHTVVTDHNGITQSVKIAELEFNHSGILEEGAMIVLTKEDGVLTMEVVDPKFTNQVTKNNWHFL